MRRLADTVWQRQGFSWLWDEQARNTVCRADEVWSLRQLFRARGAWTDELPSNHDQTLVVAGLDSALDLLAPDQAESFLENSIKPVLFSFQDYYAGEAALIFWLPSGGNRLKVHSATDAVSWLCAPPHKGESLEFGRLLWGEAREYPQEIVTAPDDAAAGLYHQRIT